MQAHPLGRDVGRGRVQRLDVGRGDPKELLVTDVLEARLARHREVGAIELELVAARGDGFVLRRMALTRSARECSWLG